MQGPPIPLPPTLPLPSLLLPSAALPTPSLSDPSLPTPSVSDPASLPAAPRLPVQADPRYMKALEGWRLAKRVTSHGPSPPPKPDLQSGTAEAQERRLAAYAEAKLEWDVMKAAWRDANTARKKKDRAERDTSRHRPSAEQQRRSQEARQRRVALKLRSAVRQKQFPLVTPATFLEFSAPGADKGYDKRRLWKRLTGERFPSRPMFWDVWPWDDDGTTWFFVFMTDRDPNDASWKGAALGFYLPFERADGQPIDMRLSVGQHKPIAWEDDTSRDLPFELERGALYQYQLSSRGYTLSASEGLIKRSPDAATGDTVEPEWMNELMLSQPQRYPNATVSSHASMRSLKDANSLQPPFSNQRQERFTTTP